ncbi:interleukin-34 [Ictalurus furcatus]|uniref:interleukin-34 n=1 Tax=Ictalurus furcatus TaxID=66913 RepID=UPI00234FF5F2|nr:interleukin-34 [Ictalurus furcatus]XP_053478997.1 interleukin-34 [Ictalurus furcatus]XP_053478998.1 interleukin-34 [Ictalurus furcatus]XP_053478999.1 interleukin-34 [Ictalurus furcatus]
MVRFEAWLLLVLLGLMWALPVWMSFPSPSPISKNSPLCTSLETLKDQLNSSLRRRYLKHNFPINYTIHVRYEEVFRLKNISKLKNDSENEKHLQDLWVDVTEIGIQRILNVLPERHPTRHKYLANLESLLKAIQTIWVKTDESYYTENIVNIFEHLGMKNYEARKSVTPKSLLDNCYRTMHCLFKDCFLRNSSQDDYCDTQHWRKVKGTQG